MKKGVLIFIFIFIFIFGFLSVLSDNQAFAQVQSSDVTLSIIPKYPTPGEQVKATVNSYVTNLDKANLSWSINGERMTSGIGKKTFTFTLGASGTTTILGVDIQTVDRQSISKSMTLNATEIDMLWEAVDSYVPPFYKGKALVSREGNFKVVAIPSITTGADVVSPNNLSYTWENGDKGQPEQSGWGKNSFIYKNSYMDVNNEIFVKVSDILGKINTGSKIILQPTNPKIVFYKKNPTLGIDLAHSLTDGYTLSSGGETVVAVPYFFTPKNLNSQDLTFGWMINGRPAPTPRIKNELKVKGEEGKTGNARIKVEINNQETLFQSLNKELNVVF